MTVLIQKDCMVDLGIFWSYSSFSVCGFVSGSVIINVISWMRAIKTLHAKVIVIVLLCKLRMRRLYTGEGDLYNYKQIHIHRLLINFLKVSIEVTSLIWLGKLFQILQACGPKENL